MWNPVQILRKTDAQTPPAVPLRRTTIAFADLKPGATVRFAIDCPLVPFTGKRAQVVSTREYRFGDDLIKSHVLNFGDGAPFMLTIAEDSQGHYLALSRPLDEIEQEIWFGRDALSFFTEPSSAKTIRCKADLMEEGAWAAARYAKSVDWVEGAVSEAGHRARRVHYNLLVNEPGEKALEIEHDDESGINRVYVTVYRPLSDIAAIESAKAAAKPVLAASNSLREDPPLFAEMVEEEVAEPPLTANPKARPDFRRMSQPGEEIHIERTVNRPQLVEELAEAEAQEPHLPAFLLETPGNYLSLDEVIPPEPERVRVGLSAAHTLLVRAMAKNVKVRDVLREMVGLTSDVAEEVIFEMPLSDADYRILAMRYRLRPDHRAEIRTRLEAELRQQLGTK